MPCKRTELNRHTASSAKLPCNEAQSGCPGMPQVAVALGAAVYLWNAGSGSIEQLMECATEDDYVTSVAWAADGKHIAVGTSSAAVQIWDAGRSRQVRALRGHSARVSALSWSGTTLSTAGRDTLVLNHDVRCGSRRELTRSSPADLNA